MVQQEIHLPSQRDRKKGMIKNTISGCLFLLLSIGWFILSFFILLFFSSWLSIEIVMVSWLVGGLLFPILLSKPFDRFIAHGLTKKKQHSKEQMLSENSDTSTTHSDKARQFKTGDRVQSGLFGQGIVLKSALTGNDEEVTVAFQGKGTKTLLASLANLRKSVDAEKKKPIPKNFPEVRTVEAYRTHMEKKRQAFEKIPYPDDWESRARARRKHDGYRCGNCGATNVELHVHHIVPLSKDGTNEITNHRTLCLTCHKKIHPHL